MKLKTVITIKYPRIEEVRWGIFIKGNIRNKPTPPNLSSKAARITDPNVGASTWAIGSH